MVVISAVWGAWGVGGRPCILAGHSALEGPDAPAQGSAAVRKAPSPENQQKNNQNYEEFWYPKGADSHFSDSKTNNLPVECMIADGMLLNN